MQTATSASTEGRPLNVPEIRQRLSDCERLMASGQLEAASLLLWSAFEAAVRASLTELGRLTDDPINSSISSGGLVSQAVAYGVIDPTDREVLLRFLPLRDAAAHGYVVLVDVSLLEEVKRITIRTLEELAAGLPLSSAHG